MTNTNPQAVLSPVALGRLGEQQRVFTSDLTVNEFALVREVGFDPLGLVMGSSIYHIGYQFANWGQSMELTVLTQAMYTAREYAMARMDAEADALGADGVVGVRLDMKFHTWGSDLIEFVAIGTAVKARAGGNWRTPTGRPFTSDLSGQDFWTLIRTGYMPVSFVLGTCVFHVAHQSFRQTLRQMGQNVEMTNYTQATYDARELAMSRMQAEAERDQAEGIVGVRVEERSHCWGANAVEFLALGTSVRSIGGEANFAPTMVMPMTD